MQRTVSRYAGCMGAVILVMFLAGSVLRPWGRVLVGMGMPLFENLDLEAVAAEAATRSRWSFMFVAAPLDLRGATGSPINPLAVF
jgi:kynurenine formamidase